MAMTATSQSLTEPNYQAPPNYNTQTTQSNSSPMNTRESKDIHAKTSSSPFYPKESMRNTSNSKFNRTTVNTEERKAKRKQALDSLNILSSNIGNFRYPGISEYQSENTLQNSVYCWTIPKEMRFASTSRGRNDSIYSLPSMKMGRSTTLGFGLRKDCRPTAGLGSPSPNAYYITTCFDFNTKNRKGVSISNKYREYMDDMKKFPGPGTYVVRKEPKINDIPITIKSRRMFFYDEDIRKKRFTVSMQKYNPSTRLEQDLRYKDRPISFGIGKRTPNENMSVIKNPGPGTYHIPGIFEQGIKKKSPLN